ncbi:hypothetical protein [Micromonospora sp. WMMD737]|uniref:hypothetical protein n=1 Tax=Micromonospora sp. WMMD737 TaxID=3404113 RepID=UPI003B92D430
MTAPFLSLPQILNRLALAARWTLRDHRPDPDGTCPICHTPDCRAATAAREVLEAIRKLRSGAARGGAAEQESIELLAP